MNFRDNYKTVVFDKTKDRILKACEDQGGRINEDHPLFYIMKSYANRDEEFRAELDKLFKE